MAYNNAVPQPGDFVSISQKQFLDNFQSMEQYWNVDHYDFNDESDTATKHRKLTMPIQTGPPTTLGDEVALYTKLTSGHANLWMRKESNGAEIQITNNGGTAIALNPATVVSFDGFGNILGDSVNVSTITVNSTDTSTSYSITFTNPISSIDYYYATSGVGRAPIVGSNVTIYTNLFDAKSVNQIVLTVGLSQSFIETVSLTVWV